MIQVQTTTATRADAERIAGALVERRIAACVQILGPVTSVYRWRGAMQRSEEWLCLIKTRRALWAALEAALREIHPYEVPEILMVPILDGSAGYLEWLRSETIE
jgi:periplasmic divalent cation tolerance protein